MQAFQNPMILLTKAMRYTILIFVLFLFVACDSEDFHSPIPDEVPGLEDLQQDYTQKLIDAEYGWYIDYRPNPANGNVGILMKFKENGTVEILSDYSGYTEWQSNSRFRVGGAVFPELIFESYSVWHKIYEQMEGEYQFRIKENEEGTFSISNARVGKEGEVFFIRKAIAEDVERLEKRGEMNDKIVNFRNSSSAYFQNISLNNYTGSWELDYHLRRITFTWPDAEGYPETETFPYYMTVDGIKFFNPIKIAGNEIDSIRLGDFDQNTIDVLYAGEAGNGEVSVSHTPAFPAPGAADYYMITSRPNELFLLNVEIEDFSQAYQPEINNMMEKRPGIVRMQLYNNDLRFNPTFRVAIYYVDPDDGQTYYANIFYTATKIGEDQVKYTFGSDNTNARNISDAIEPLLDRLFDEEGFTVVPYTQTATNQTIRLVSIKDSRYYITARSALLNYLY